MSQARDLQDFEEQLLLDCQPSPELHAAFHEAFNDQAPDLYARLKTRNAWVHGWFRKKVRNEETARGLEDRTFERYLSHMRNELWREQLGLPPDEHTLNPVLRLVARHLGRKFRDVQREYFEQEQHEELVDQFLGIDDLTEEDLEEDCYRMETLCEQSFTLADLCVAPTKSDNAATYVLNRPKQWFWTIAENVFCDYTRQRGREKRREELTENKKLDQVAVRWFNPEKRLLNQARFSEIRKRYLAAVEKLAPTQRVAWILLKDELLDFGEIQRFLLPDLHKPIIEGVLRARSGAAECARGPEAERLMGRDLSPDASKARVKLAKELADLDPFRASREPALEWPSEFLIGLSARRAPFPILQSTVAPMPNWPSEFPRSSLFAARAPGEIPALLCTLMTGRRFLSFLRDDIEEYIRRLPRRELPTPAPNPKKSTRKRRGRPAKEAAETEATRQPDSSLPPIELNSSPAPARIDADQAEALRKISYRCGGYFKGCMNCGQVRRVGSRKLYESGYAVFRSYSPEKTGWTFWCYECGAKDARCWEECGSQLGRAPKSKKRFPVQR